VKVLSSFQTSFNICFSYIWQPLS